MNKKLNEQEQRLFADVRQLIEEARNSISKIVNTGLTLLYWNIGKRINHEVLQNQRAEYGKSIVATVSRQLTEEYGKGYTEKSIRRMMQFNHCFSDEKAVVNLSQHLTWSHFVEIIPLKTNLERDFYSELCRTERWSVRTLRDKIRSMLFERTAISQKPEELARAELKALREEDEVSPDLVFRNPYVLDFLGLKGRFQEKPIGIILCAEGNHEQIELLQLEKTNIKIGQYITKYLPKDLLKGKLRQFMKSSKKQIENL